MCFGKLINITPLLDFTGVFKCGLSGVSQCHLGQILFQRLFHPCLVALALSIRASVSVRTHKCSGHGNQSVYQ